MVTYGIDKIRPIRYLEISDPDFVFKINPLKRRAGVDPAVPAAAAVDAVLKGPWGRSGQGPDAQPQLVETLTIAFAAISELGGAFVDAAKLLELDDATGLRNHVAEKSENDLIRSFFRTIDAHHPREREALLGSARRRLVKFLLPRRAREIFSEPSAVIDWRSVLDNGEAVLLNLAHDERGIVSEEQAKTVGTLILNDIFLACRGRSSDALTGYVYWDEVHQYATEAAARLFTEARNFKVHPVFAHQIYEQLNEVSSFVREAIMSCRNKVFFGGLPLEDAELAARFAFRGQFDFQKPKPKFDKPVVVDHIPEWMHSESETQGSSVAHGPNWSVSDSLAQSESTTKSSSQTISSSDTTSQSRTRSAATTQSSSSTRSQSDTASQSTSDQWSRSHSSGTSTSAADTRSSSTGWGISLSQDFPGWFRSRSSRTTWPQPGAQISDSWSGEEGRATTNGSTSSSSVSNAQGGASATGSARMEGIATQRGTAATTGSAQSHGTAHSDGTAMSEGIATTVGTTRSRSLAEGGSETDTSSEATTAGRSQSLRPVLRTMPTQSYTLEELVEKAAARIANLDQGQCIIKIGKRPAAQIRTLRVTDGWASNEQIAAAKARMAAQAPYVRPALEPPKGRRLAHLRIISDNGTESPEPINTPKEIDDEWG